MPRPKRSKVAPSKPINSRIRVAEPVPKTSTAPKQENVLTPVSSGRVANGSDESDGLVVSRNINVNKETSAANTYTMSGALAAEDMGESQLEPPTRQTRTALSRIVREADYEKSRQERSRKIAKANLSAELDQVPSSIPTTTVNSKRPSPALGRSSARESSQGVSGPRVQETPRLHSSSMLGGVTFKKRPRQPSLLQMVRPHNNTLHDMSDDNDMYDFLPDDESTPLIKSLSQSKAQSKPPSSQQTSGSRKRKMKSPEIQVPASQSFSIPSSPSPVPSQTEIPQTISEADDQPEPTLPQLRSPQTPQPQIFSDTLAPPHSSSSPPEPEAKAARKKPTKEPRKTKAPPHNSHRKQLSSARPPLSSPSTQPSPVRPTKPEPKPLTTATLQNLLPRRRARPKPKGSYDIPSSSDVELNTNVLGDDEDELSFHTTSKTRPKKKTIGTIAQKRAAKVKEARTGAGKGKRVSKTYTRKSINEPGDENEIGSASDEEDTGARGRSKTPRLDGKVKAEMRRLADKFREVDEYALDFEDVTGSSSQMRDAR